MRSMSGPIRWRDGRLELLDQTRLPDEEIWLRCERAEDVADAIRRLAVRGAPAIGIAAAYGLALDASRFDEAAELLGSTRPTAVNLAWAIERQREAREAGADLAENADRLAGDQLESDRRMAEHGARLFGSGERVLTHCNTGALATGGYGTAIGVIKTAFDAGKVERVWVDETRPLLQGSRLTAWELDNAEIPFKVVTDSSVGTLMSQGLVDRVVVGADRIAANGDTANKIGTYTVAVVAARHGVPFHVAAPLSTVDPDTPSGTHIPIERRNPTEVTTHANAENWAFDVTPAELIASIITEAGVHEPPYDFAR
jgi:methylthioribose-1-phosphate isomerase